MIRIDSTNISSAKISDAKDPIEMAFLISYRSMEAQQEVVRGYAQEVQDISNTLGESNDILTRLRNVGSGGEVSSEDSAWCQANGIAIPYDETGAVDTDALADSLVAYNDQLDDISQEKMLNLEYANNTLSAAINEMTNILKRGYDLKTSIKDKI